LRQREKAFRKQKLTKESFDPQPETTHALSYFLVAISKAICVCGGVKFYPKPKPSKQILVSTVIPFFHAVANTG
jgi:hypothetical protein